MGVTQKLLLSLSDSFSEKYLQPAQIESFIRKESRITFQQLSQNGIESLSDTEQSMLLRMDQHLPDLGLVAAPMELEIEEKKVSQEEIHTWKTSLEKGRVINKGVLRSKSAIMLLMMLNSTEKESGFLEENMEILLRHVEVKREQALHNYSDPLSKPDCWEERCTTGVLFSSFAAQKNDWRFLNGALKLNEWLWKEYHRPFAGLPSLPLLASLVEQEAAFRELQSC
jgi:hypothetical protein